MYYECRHILPSGARCESPALRGQSFCYFHRTQRHQATARPRAPHHDPHLCLPLIEDAHSIQQSLNAVLQALAASRLQPRTASLLLYGLQVASSNLRALKSHDIYSSVRSAHTLPDGTLIADNHLVIDFEDTPEDLDRFEENHPAPEEPGETPIDDDDQEYDDDEEDDEDTGSEEEEDEPDSDDDEEDEDEEDGDEEDGDEEDGDEEEDDEESDDEDGDNDADDKDEEEEDEEEDKEEPEDDQGEPAHPTPEPPQTDGSHYRQYIRQQLFEAFLRQAAAIPKPATGSATRPNHDPNHTT